MTVEGKQKNEEPKFVAPRLSGKLVDKSQSTLFEPGGIMLASRFVKTLGEVVIRHELDDLKQQIPLDSPAKVTSEPRDDLIRWFWKGLLYTDDEMSVRVSLGYQSVEVVRAKVRSYYDKAFASTSGNPPGKRNRQEIYTGKTRMFMVDTDSEVIFSAWLKDELRKCTAALQRQT
jgi:hypothetical protein